MLSIDDIFSKYRDTLDAKGVAFVEEPYRTIIIVWTVQSILDNGGFEYLFENKFPEGMPIDLIKKSYEAIGANKMAKFIEEAYVHRDNLSKIQELDSKIVAYSDEVWSKINGFVQKNNIIVD